MVISQMVQKLSRWQTHTPTHPQTYTTENNILLRTSIVSLHYCCAGSNNMRTFYNQQLVDLCCTSRSLTISLLTCEIVYIGYQFSSGWSTRSVYWSTSVSSKQLHHIRLRCAFPSQQPTTDVTATLQLICDLAVPRIRLARYGRRSFAVSGPLMWNSLPLTVRDVSLTLTQFCARLKTFLFSIAYGTWS